MPLIRGLPTFSYLPFSFNLIVIFVIYSMNPWAALFKTGLLSPRVSVKSDFKSVALKEDAV